MSQSLSQRPLAAQALAVQPVAAQPLAAQPLAAQPVAAQPLVSILINNYNYGDYLAAAIDSALAQTYGPIEVIVVDDGSTDHSAEVLAAYADRVKVVLQANGGQAAAFNHGFDQSQGEIICFLDADDLFAPEKVAQVVTALQQDEYLGWCFHPLTMWQVQTDERVPSQPDGIAGIYDIRSQIQRGKLGRYVPIGLVTSGLSFRRSLLAQLLPMPESIRITSDDYLKYAALGLAPGYVLVDDLAIQRIHGNNAYTQRGDRRLLRGETQLLTAYWLYHNFPGLGCFSDTLFALGLYFCRGLQPGAPSNQDFVQDYWRGLSWYRRSQILLRSYYYHWRAFS
jgi:glycosyltransferase involved in cell wall biosynthesis